MPGDAFFVIMAGVAHHSWAGAIAMLSIERTEPRAISFEAFLSGYGRENGRYELRRGVPMPLAEPNANHEDVVAFLCLYLMNFCEGLSLVPRQNKQIRLVPDEDGLCSTRYGDIVVFDGAEWDRMKGLSISAVAYVAPPLVIEVVSTNWRDDYRVKLGEYEALGISEYWVVDYAGLGGIQYIGAPKRPTLTVFRLVDGEYEPMLFRGGDRIVSGLLPGLELTAAEIFAAA
jgi:Uma2 family endonuclease